MESHGHCAKPEDVKAYVSKTYSNAVIQQELSDPGNIYHILFYDEKPVGYSKIVLNCSFEGSPVKNITKLERLYLLEEYYNLKLGVALFEFNKELSKKNKQMGIWLYTWIENKRAVNFYMKNGFSIIGSYNFKISDTHSNPNHQLFLAF